MSPRQKRLVAIAIGVVLAGMPVAGVNLWLNGLSERQGREELEASARRHLFLVERRIGRAVTVLNELAARGVDSCRAAHVDALRQATFANAPVKELSVVAPDGRTLCSDMGASESRKLVSSETLSTDSNVLLQVIRIGDRPEHWLRIVRPAAAGGNALAVLIPSELFVPQTSTSGGPVRMQTRMSTRQGAVISERMGGAHTTSSAPGEPEGWLNITIPSEEYALVISFSLPRAKLAENLGEVRMLGAIGSGTLALLILAVAVLLPRRRSDNPFAEIERALKAGEFVPYYQPVVDIRSGRLRGAEVLARWRKKDGTIVPPASFIPLMESSGMIIELTRVLMRKARDELGSHLGPRPQLKIGFNLTARHFANEEIVADIRRIFSGSAIRLTQIELEVTERHPLGDLTETRRVIASLQGLGVRIAIDDVGTGHSGLSYMLKLGVDIIKIDKMFIDSLGTDRNSNTIIETLIDLAQNMRMDIVAEGVETFEQVAALRELGIRAAQGYVFAPPLPGTSFIQLVEAIEPIKQGTATGPATLIQAAREVA